MRRWLAWSMGLVLNGGWILGLQAATPDAAPLGSPFRVQLDGSVRNAAGGRLLLFASPAAQAIADAHGKVEAVDADPFRPDRTSVAAREVSRLVPGQSVLIDADSVAFPAPFSHLPAGDYLVQAVLDTDHSYNYTGRGPGDLLSDVVRVHLPARVPPTLKLTHAVPQTLSWTLPPEASAELHAALPAARADTDPIDQYSRSMSRFWGRSVHFRGWVLRPPGYRSHPADAYPTVYYTHGFGGGGKRMLATLVAVHRAMQRGEMPPMIWVMLDQSTVTGTHEFADSVNNGPWGKALTEELLPALETRYRMLGKPAARFLVGHSSGGWAALWLQTSYPAEFGGCWATAPDPPDFHDFSGVDLDQPHVNMYVDQAGHARPFMRADGKVLGSIANFARLEDVFGSYGGQLASYEWVFSPRGSDGRPMPLFDRDTGVIDQRVARYWREHYDIAWRLQRDWPLLRRDLDGKLHIYVGDQDTFYLDASVRRLQGVLQRLHARADLRFLPGKTHFDLYQRGNDPLALLKEISWQMYHQLYPQAQPSVAVAP